MIHYEIDDDAEPSLSTSFGEFDKISQRTIAGIDSIVVGDVVTIVATRRRLEWKEPDCCYAESLQVIEPTEQALKITDAVGVGIEVSSNRQAIDNCIFVPQVVDHRVPLKSSGYRLPVADRL